MDQLIPEIVQCDISWAYNDDSAFSSAPACHELESFLFSPGAI